MLAVMRQIARAQGFDHSWPRPPSWKNRYPLMPIAVLLCRMRRSAFDPWLRVHVRAGGHVYIPAQRA